MKNKKSSTCDSCTYYAWDDDYECYTCEACLDEDEMSHFLSDAMYTCPYYRNGDEYKVVRKQI